MALQLSALADRRTITTVKVGSGSHSQVPRALLKVEDARMRLWGETQKDNVFLIQTRQSTTSLLCSNLSAAISSLTLRSIAGLVEVSGLSGEATSLCLLTLPPYHMALRMLLRSYRYPRFMHEKSKSDHPGNLPKLLKLLVGETELEPRPWDI